ncbi:MAG TPA: HAMP domain-containing protein [Candidatus Binatia bacterium]|nr:HAMP domain-containing protein [Candidatus Binatia bacterium]
MRTRFFGFLLVLVPVCGALLLIFLDVDQQDSVTLADLLPFDDKNSSRAGGVFDFIRSIDVVDSMFFWISDPDSVLYAVLAIGGVLIAFRAVMSLVRTMTGEGPHATQPISSFLDNPTRPASEKVKAGSPVRSFMDFDSPASEHGHNVSPVTARFESGAILQQLSYCTRGVTGRMIFTFAGILAMLGLSTIALVFLTVSSSLKKNIVHRGILTAVNVSDSAPQFLFANNAAGLRELLHKTAGQPELAYILVENRAGEIFAHSFAVLPPEIQGGPSVGNSTEAFRTLRIGDAVVEEVSVPILEGRGGIVRVGLWLEQMQAEINETVFPLVKLLGVITACGILIAVFLAWRINRPIFRLIAVAKAISTGNLDVSPPRLEDAGEFGDLSRAIERMRSSVKAAMIRLSR